MLPWRLTGHSPARLTTVRRWRRVGSDTLGDFGTGSDVEPAHRRLAVALGGRMAVYDQGNVGTGEYIADGNWQFRQR